MTAAILFVLSGVALAYGWQKRQARRHLREDEEPDPALRRMLSKPDESSRDESNVAFLVGLVLLLAGFASL